MSHATTPVRSIILTKLMNAVEAIESIKTVRRFQVPSNLTGVELPAAYLFEIAPEDRSYSNRIAIATMHLQIQVFFPITLQDMENSSFSDIYDKMDVMAADLHTIYHTSVGLSKNGLVNIVELTYDRIITNDSIGWLNSTFDVEYRHDRGNAFS